MPIVIRVAMVLGRKPSPKPQSGRAMAAHSWRGEGGRLRRIDCSDGYGPVYVDLDRAIEPARLDRSRRSRRRAWRAGSRSGRTGEPSPPGTGQDGAVGRRALGSMRPWKRRRCQRAGGWPPVRIPQLHQEVRVFGDGFHSCEIIRRHRIQAQSTGGMRPDASENS